MEERTKENPPVDIEQLKREARLRVGNIKYADSVYNFAHELQKRHPDYLKYRVYHQLVGSTPWAEVVEEDFAGGDSVVEFLKSLEK